MAVLDGFIPLPPDTPVESPALSLGMRAFQFLDYPYRDSIVTESRSAFSIVDNLPVSAAAEVKTGGIPRSFYDDFYERIHIIPNPVDLGNVVSGFEQIVDVWNSFSVSKTMTAFTPPDDTGITVTTPGALPLMLAPYSLYEYTLAVSKEGPPEINDDLEWTISGIDYVVPIVGRRVLLWPFMPSWDNRFEETLEWRTGLERAYDGTEQRAMLRAEPRRIFEYTVKLTNEDAQALDTLLYGWGSRLYGSPVWPERSKLTAGAAVGATVLSLDTTNRSFVAGGFLALYADRISNESCEIVSVTSNSITVKKPLLNSWPAATRVYPLLISRLEATTAQRYTDSVSVAAVRFVGSPQETDPRIPAVAAPLTYDGKELYLGRTNWGEVVQFAYVPDSEIIDSTTGVYRAITRSDFPSLNKTHTWTLKNATAITDYRAWLGRRGGMAKPVWMPTDTSDMTLLETLALSAVDAKMALNGFERYVIGKPGRDRLMFQLKNGTYYIRTIVGAAAGVTPGTMSIEIDSPLGIDVAPTDIRRICFLGLWRLASDAVTLVYETDNVATVSATLKLVKP
jgi:hypothetical protein